MLRACSVIRRGDLTAHTAADTITLDRQARHCRRVRLTGDRGTTFLLDLPDATTLADGDVLTLDDGRVVRVVAAPEPLMEIHAADALALARIAWHLGNRHTPAEVTAHAIYIQPDHVLAGMVAGLGAHVHEVMRPFEPEGGAYGHKGTLAGRHAHGHGDHHHHGHAHGPGLASHNHDHGKRGL